MHTDGRLHARRPPRGGGGALDNVRAAVDAVAVILLLLCGCGAAAGFDARDGGEAGAAVRFQHVCTRAGDGRVRRLAWTLGRP